MSEKSKNTQTDIVERGKEILHEGNIRHVIIKNPEGKVLADTSLTVAVAISAALVFFVPGGLVLAVLAGVGAAFARLRVEIVRELNDDDSILEISRKSKIEDVEEAYSEPKERLSKK